MNAIPESARAAAQASAAVLPRWARLGALFGLVSFASIALWGPIGVSGTYPRFAGAWLRRLAPAWAAGNGYLIKMGDLLKPESFLVLGLLVGGFLAARLSRERAPATEPIHPGREGAAARHREAFLGGFLILFGARLAGGCTSGHVISGITQLSVSGMVFGAGVFAAGILTARALQRGGR